MNDATLARYFAEKVRNQTPREHMNMIARGLCCEWFKRRNPGCSERRAGDYATRHWPEWKAQAIDIVIILAVEFSRDVAARDRVN